MNWLPDPLRFGPSAAIDVIEHLTHKAEANARIERATLQAQRYWTRLYGDDELLLSVPGVGPVTACIIRGFLADGTPFGSAKAAASYVGLNPSTWSSGTVSQPSRAITKEGPAVLRLAFFQAGNGPAGKTCSSPASTAQPKIVSTASMCRCWARRSPMIA